MQSNLVSRPDESTGFGTFCGHLYPDRGIFSTLLQCQAAWTFSIVANEEALHFGRTGADFLQPEMRWIKGFGDICIFKVIPILCN
jgi:hypothetical protein